MIDNTFSVLAIKFSFETSECALIYNHLSDWSIIDDPTTVT